jgi:hypothetical protein
MATVRINRAQARVESVEAGVRLVTQVMYEIAFEAFVTTIRGPYATGRLATSIERDGPDVVGDRIFGRVGSRLPYAASVHDGAKVHAIFPKAGGHVYRFGSRRAPQLKFFWRRAGRIAYFPHIPGSPARLGRSHPGQPGKKYLTEPLRNAARRHSMHVITLDE